MFIKIFRIVVAALFLAAAALPVHADIIVRLKDGRAINLAVSPDEIQSIDFGKDINADANRISGLPPAPKPLLGVTMRGDKRVLAVGPSRALKNPSDATRVAENGDIIEIDAGDYRGDVAVWKKNNLTIRGIGGRPHIDAGGNNADDKALWVIKGANTTIENIEISGARVADENGAGIRQEGPNLTLDNCYLHDNQMGILTGADPLSDIIIRNSEFARNRLEAKGSSHIGHNIYIGAVRSFTLINTYVHDAMSGHNVKSRAAHSNILKNRIEDGKNGSASYLLDLPAGGVAVVQGNYFQKGSKAENPGSISYGAEKMLHQTNSLTVTGNNFTNQHWSGIFVDNHSDVAAKISNNRFKGPGVILRGPGSVSNNQAEP
jgi:hypothetical protein